MTTLISGMAYLKIDGQNYSTNGEFESTIQNTKNTPIVDESGNIHYSEAKQVSTISGNLYTTPELDVQTIVDATDTVVQVEFKNGKTALLNQAMFTGDATVSATDGTLAVEFSGVGEWV